MVTGLNMSPAPEISKEAEPTPKRRRRADPADPADPARAAALSDDACPRRYCWWWRSAKFEWDVPAAGGCEFPHHNDPPVTIVPGVPCRRAVPGAASDHYEASPYLITDDVDPARWEAAARRYIRTHPDRQPGGSSGSSQVNQET